MRIGLIAYGTRGDVQPLLALGLGLRHAGHDVTLLAGSNFERWIRGYGLGFADMGVDIQALMQSPDGIAWVEAPGWQQPAHMRRLFSKAAQPTMDGIWAFSGTQDLLISSFTSDGLTLSAAEKRRVRWMSAGLQPLRPTRAGYATFMAPRPRSESALNLGMGRLSELALWTAFGDSHNRFRTQLGLKPHSFADYRRVTYHAPLVYGYSPQVMPRPADYLPHWQVSGYWFLDEPDWQPPDTLKRFLDAGAPPVYIGFGSATDSDAEKTTATILRAVRESGQRALISGGWAGLSPRDDDPNVLFIGGMPHSWLFPQVSAVVHHGGSGTTGAGVRAGLPALLIPHFAEQPQWARRLHELGVSPRPIDKKKLTAPALAAGLDSMARDTSMRMRAAELGTRVRAEDGVGAAVGRIADCKFQIAD
jgi:sterol 3beta-glucosyltransferase